jgi:hypothetical protein
MTGYTPGYAGTAARLRADSERLGVELIELPYRDAGAWHLNCLQKPLLIARVARERRAPVLWIDADARLHRAPVLLEDPPFAFAACPSRAGIGRAWCTGTLYFAPGAAALAEAWCARTEELLARGGGTDELGLNEVWRALEAQGTPPDFAPLPHTYGWLPKDGPPTREVVIQHTLSGNARKRIAPPGGVT